MTSDAKLLKKLWEISIEDIYGKHSDYER